MRGNFHENLHFLDEHKQCLLMFIHALLKMHIIKMLKRISQKEKRKQMNDEIAVNNFVVTFFLLFHTASIIDVNVWKKASGKPFIRTTPTYHRRRIELWKQITLSKLFIFNFRRQMYSENS